MEKGRDVEENKKHKHALAHPDDTVVGRDSNRSD